MSYDFTKYSDYNSRTSDSFISITQSFTFGLSSAFSNTYDITKYGYVVFYYDSVAQAIGLKFTNDQKEPSKFAITRRENAKGFNIGARSFFKKNGLNPEEFAGKYVPKKLSSREAGIEGTGNLFVIDLKSKNQGFGIEA
jgi:hypothetical protein